MSGISSGIGLISGIDQSALIDQLMEIEARPVRTLEARVGAVDVQRAAFLGLSAKILALQNAARRFDELSFFRQFGTSSTNENVLTALASEFAQPGVHTFRVSALATNHAVLSRGFNDPDQTPLGTGTLTISEAQSRVNQGTELSALNGGHGVGRGVITITDRTGASADIDLSRAFTVQDILDAINHNETVNVRARTTGLADNGGAGDRIVIEDLTADADVMHNLVIADKGIGTTATDLGIVADTAENRVDGHDLLRLSPSTSLAQLNDGNGIGIAGLSFDDLVFVKGGSTNETFNVSLANLLKYDTDLRALNSGASVRLDGPSVIRLTDRSGASVEVDFSDLNLAAGATIQDITDRVEQEAQAAGVKISLGLVNSHLQVLDGTGLQGEEVGNLIVEDVSGSLAADLGILGDAADADIQGRDIYRVSSIGDVINAINFAPGNQDAIVRASLSDDGKGIRLEALEFGSTITVSAAENSTAAQDLGLLDAVITPDGVFDSRRLVGGLNAVLLQTLNGGQGIEAGAIQLTDRANRTTTIDFGDPAIQPKTLQDVIDAINADGNTSLVGSINAAGTGIEIHDETPDDNLGGFIVITDLNGGTLAADLGIARPFGEVAGDRIDGGHLHRQYVARQTALSDLNAGLGVTLGDFQVTDSAGGVFTVQLADNSSITTVGALIDQINRAAPGRIEARINDTGDGIAIHDIAGGEGTLTIEDIDGGQAAKSLRLVGSAKVGESVIDGSFQTKIEIGPTDTLDEVARKINEAGGIASASVLDDGSTINPYSLTVTATASGRRGELLFDEGGLDLGFRTMTKGQDALISTGEGEFAQSAVIASPTNTLENVIDGVTLNLLAVSDDPVTIRVDQDLDTIVEDMKRFVELYNDVQDTIDEATSFDTDTLERGPLLGDGTISQIRSRLFRSVTGSFAGTDPSVSRLSAIGIRPTSNNHLEFNEARFRETYEQSPELVEQLFTAKETGFGALIDETLQNLAGDFDSVISRKSQLLDDQQELLNDRIDRLNVLLDARRARLESQFVGLESSLAVLQGQQTSLNILAQIANSVSA